MSKTANIKVRLTAHQYGVLLASLGEQEHADSPQIAATARALVDKIVAGTKWAPMRKTD